MKWFKTIWLSSKEREILRKAQNNELVDRASSQVNLEEKPYDKIIYSNGTVTVIFKSGVVISKSDTDYNFLDRVKQCVTEAQIRDLFSNKTNSTDSTVSIEEEIVSNNLDILINNKAFNVVGSTVYMKGVNLPIPAPVVASFIEILEKSESCPSKELDDQFNALKMFWLKLALNSLPQSREDLLTFIRKNDVKITRNGNLILYRRVVSRGDTDKKLVAFVTQEYYRIKKSGEDPRLFAVYEQNNNYGIVDLREYDPISKPTDIIPFCNLQQMYLELPNHDSNDFTAWHGKGTTIKIGGVYKIPENEINLDNSICAAGGLHAAAVDYDYSGFGDTPVVVLVNPSKAITVPLGETGKLRTTEMFVACVNDKPHGEHFDEGALSAFDSEYHDFTLDELEEAAKSKSFGNLSVKDNVPAVSLIDLNEIRKMLTSRIEYV